MHLDFNYRQTIVGLCCYPCIRKHSSNPQDKIALFATHVVSDIEYIAKEIILIKRGKLLLKEEPAQILRRLETRVCEIHLEKEDVSDFVRTHKVSNIFGDKDGMTARFLSDPNYPGSRCRFRQTNA